MSNAIFIALSGAILKEKQMELISQNLANSNSSAYKKMRAVFKDYLTSPESEQEGKIMGDLASITTDFSNGGIHQTGNTLDIALEGDGFFALENNRFTRRGDFKISTEGQLTTQTGIPVLGLNGAPIYLPPGKLEIGPGGEVTVNQAQLDTLKVVDFAKKDSLARLGEDLFQTDDPGSPAKTLVKQGHLEGSNVEVVKEMTQIIMTLREFQAFQKVIQGFDDADSKMIDVARI
jgi:flagellar basal-body rod protein FlgF